MLGSVVVICMLRYRLCDAIVESCHARKCWHAFNICYHD